VHYNLSAIEYFYLSMNLRFTGSLWTIAFLLCRIADEEGWKVSAAVTRIAHRSPLLTDQTYPSFCEGETAEAKYWQKRASVIYLLKSEIKSFLRQAKEQETKRINALKNEKSAAGLQPRDAYGKGGNL